MSMGNSPADKYLKSERLMAKADADRAARLAGHKPLIERLLERLRPHRQEPGSDPQNFPRTPSDPGN
jgi:hypothetical protein